jgi:uncharacterized membrane protein
VVVSVRQNTYSEWISAGLFVKTMVTFVIIVVLCVLSITVITGVAFQNPFWIIISASVTLFLLLLFWNYRGIKIQLNNKDLLVSYGVFNQKSIRLEDIVSCETIKASFGRYGGVGVRYGIDESWAYTTSFGNAVKMIPRKGRPFAFSSNNPQKICNILNQTRSVA